MAEAEGQAVSWRRAGRRAAVAGLAVAASAGLIAAGLPASATPHYKAVSTGHHKVVKLPTGDKVLVVTDAANKVKAATAVNSSKQTFISQRINGDTYVVPARALHKIGTGAWSLAQFDVSALAAGRAGSNPGTGTAHPNYPMRTISFNVTDAAGKAADEADMAVVNTDNALKYAGFPIAVDGQARISVPDGHYAYLSYQPTYDADGNVTAERLLFGQFTVSGKAATLDLKMSNANHQVSVSTPKPTNSGSLDMTWVRGSSEAAAVGWIFSSSLDHPVYLSSSPDGPGIQHFYVHSTLTSPASATSPYLYDVEYPSEGAIGANQSYTVRPSSLATIDSSYYSDKADRQAASVLFGALPWDAFIFRQDVPIAGPVHRVEYVTARPDLVYDKLFMADEENFAGIMDNGNHVYGRGQQVNEEWLRGPIAPGFPAPTTGDYYCWACRVDDTMSIYLSPMTDTDPYHEGSLDYPDGKTTISTSHYQLYQGSKRIYDGTDVAGADVTVPAANTKYKLVYDQTRIAPWTTQSTKSHTEWTFSSKHSGSTTVPSTWYCGPGSVQKHCSAVTLLDPEYDLDQSLSGTVKPGAGELTLTLGHTPGAASVPVDAATVKVSFDGGKTWTATTVKALGDNAFQADWTNPDSGNLAIQISAKDAAGNSITQTVYDAATIAG